jgi:hypothetical protein
MRISQAELATVEHPDAPLVPKGCRGPSPSTLARFTVFKNRRYGSSYCTR